MNQAATLNVNPLSITNINPELPQESRKIHYLTPWDLAMLSADYIQKGLLFHKPPTPIATILHHLKHSLSQTLIHFPVLLGRLVTKKEFDPPFYSVYLDCTDQELDPRGAHFLYAVTDLTVSDVMTTNDDLPNFIQSFFGFSNAVNHDGHTSALLVVQVTELFDGIFIGCSFNHVIVDGTSAWHFFNAWAEIARNNIQCISRPPIIERLFLDGNVQMINLPFTHHDEFIERYSVPPSLRERMFHFSSKGIGQLKAKANEEANTTKISSFQALTAFLWRCMTRARNLPSDQKMSCKMAINSRYRLQPALPDNYFGNCIQTVSGSTTVGELLGNNLGWSARMMHVAVMGHTDEKIRSFVEKWMKNPVVYQLGRFFEVHSMMMGSSPRFDMYGNDFGWGKPIAVRSGHGNKFDGKVSSYPGKEGDGSVDLEVCLCDEYMSALLLDIEFMSVVS